MNGNITSDYIFKVYVVDAQAHDIRERDTGVWLYFPPYVESIQAVFEKIGLPHDAVSDVYFVDDYAHEVESLEPLLPIYGDADELAALVQGLYDLSSREYGRLKAIQSSSLCLTTLEQFREHPWNMDHFCLDIKPRDDAVLEWN